jgi:hypothetical protein
MRVLRTEVRKNSLAVVEIGLLDLQFVRINGVISRV